MPHSNGQIYIETVGGVTYGVSVADIQQTLGRGTGDVGLLLSDQEWYENNGVEALRHVNKINKWAKYKPNGSTLKAVLTLVQRQAANCGIDCSDSSTGCFSTSLSSLLARAKSNCTWNKVVPTVFRLRDFDGYNHNARPPYEQVPNIIGNTTGDQTTNITVTLVRNDDIDNVQVSDLVEALTRFGNTVSQFAEGLLIRNADTPSATPTVLTSNNSSYIFPAPASYGSPITYDCVFVKYVNNNGTYWAVFYPNTYFQAKLALFYVSIENQTLNFTAQGGEDTLIISGYNWEASWGGKGNPNADIVMAMSPSQGGTISPWSEVVLTVQPSTPQYTTSITKVVTISIPGGFTKQFTVKQACSLKTGYIALVDDNDQDAGTEVILTNTSLEAEREIHIRSDRSWKVADQNTSQGAGIVYKIVGDDTGTYYDARSEITISPSSATISTGTHTTKNVYIINLVALPSNHMYEVLFVSTDGVASFRLRINQQGQQ